MQYANFQWIIKESCDDGSLLIENNNWPCQFCWGFEEDVYVPSSVVSTPGSQPWYLCRTCMTDYKINNPHVPTPQVEKALPEINQLPPPVVVHNDPEVP